MWLPKTYYYNYGKSKNYFLKRLDGYMFIRIVYQLLLK